MYISKTKNPSGGYTNPRTNRMDGDLILPNSLLPEYLIHNGFVMLTVDGDIVSSISPDTDLIDKWMANNPIPVKIPSQLRETAYNTDANIPWQGANITVTQASSLWTYYTAEGNTATANSLTALIATAKQETRIKYPEENVSNLVAGGSL